MGTLTQGAAPALGGKELIGLLNAELDRLEEANACLLARLRDTEFRREASPQSGPGEVASAMGSKVLRPDVPTPRTLSPDGAVEAVISGPADRLATLSPDVTGRASTATARSTFLSISTAPGGRLAGSVASSMASSMEPCLAQCDAICEDGIPENLGGSSAINSASFVFPGNLVPDGRVASKTSRQEPRLSPRPSRMGGAMSNVLFDDAVVPAASPRPSPRPSRMGSAMSNVLFDDGLVPAVPARRSILVNIQQRSSKWAGKIGLQKTRSRHAFEENGQAKQDILRGVTVLESTPEVTLRKNMAGKGTIWARIVTSRVFEAVSLAAITLNAIWLAIDVDLNPAAVITEAIWYFQVVEHFFCLFFSMEWVVVVLAAESKAKLFQNRWFLFDTAIVANMVGETWVLPWVVSVLGGSGVLGIDASIFRLLRLTRLSRISRMMRAVPEMVFMLKGLAQATRTVSCTMVLLMSVVYTFGIILRQLSVGTEMGEEYFGSVPEAMYTCLMAGTLLDDVRRVMNAVRAQSEACAVAFGLLIMFSALTMMNMLVGVLCDVIGQVAHKEKEALTVASVKQQLRDFLAGIAGDVDGYITKEEFANLLLSSKAIAALSAIGVDVVALVDSADLLFQSDEHGQQFDKKVDFDTFMDIVLQLRGDNKATVRDLMNLRKYIHTENTKRNLGFLHLEENQKELANNQQRIHNTLLKELRALGTTVRADLSRLSQVRVDEDRTPRVAPR